MTSPRGKVERRHQGAASECEKLTSRTLKRKEGPQGFFYEVDRWKTHKEQMGETVSDYEGIIIQALPAEYDYVKNKSHTDRNFDLKSIRRTINNIYIDNLSRSSRNGNKSVVGRGATMQAAGRRPNSDECADCEEISHRHNNYAKLQRHWQPQLHNCAAVAASVVAAWRSCYAGG